MRSDGTEANGVAAGRLVLSALSVGGIAGQLDHSTHHPPPVIFRDSRMSSANAVNFGAILRKQHEHYGRIADREVKFGRMLDQDIARLRNSDARVAKHRAP